MRVQRDQCPGTNSLVSTQYHHLFSRCQEKELLPSESKWMCGTPRASLWVSGSFVWPEMRLLGWEGAGSSHWPQGSSWLSLQGLVLVQRAQTHPLWFPASSGELNPAHGSRGSSRAAFLTVRTSEQAQLRETACTSFPCHLTEMH